MAISFDLRQTFITRNLNSIVIHENIFNSTSINELRTESINISKIVRNENIMQLSDRYVVTNHQQCYMWPYTRQQRKGLSVIIPLILSYPKIAVPKCRTHLPRLLIPRRNTVPSQFYEYLLFNYCTELVSQRMPLNHLHIAVLRYSSAN